MTFTAPVKVIATVRSKSSAAISLNGPYTAAAAFETRMSIRPIACAAAAIACAACVRSATSATSTCASTPSARTARATFSSPLGERAIRASVAPRFAKACAVAAPIPLLPPVMTTHLPSSSRTGRRYPVEARRKLRLRARSAARGGLVVRRADRLRLGRAALAQVHAEDRHRSDRQELRLPVLQRRLPEVRRAEVSDVRHLGLLVGDLVRVVGAPAAGRVGEPGAEEDRGHQQDQRVRVDPRPPAAGARPARRVRLGVLAEELVLVAALAGLAGLLRLGRAALNEPHGAEDVERELEELGLPVLHHRLPELRARDVAAERDGRLLVGHGVVVELVVAGDRLRRHGREEDRQEDDRKRVEREEAAHGLAQWCVRPITEKYAIPAQISTKYSQNIAFTVGGYPLEAQVTRVADSGR